jgi:hypothetical protein
MPAPMIAIFGDGTICKFRAVRKEGGLRRSLRRSERCGGHCMMEVYLSGTRGESSPSHRLSRTLHKKFIADRNADALCAADLPMAARPTPVRCRKSGIIV